MQSNILKHLPKIIVCSTLLFHSYSCNTDRKGKVEEKEISTQSPLKRIEVDQGYAVEVPKDMIWMDDLNDVASLQYGDADNELYIVVIDEPTSGYVRYKKNSGESVEGQSVLQVYKKDQLSALGKGWNNTKIHMENPYSFGDAKAEMVQLDTQLQGTDIPISYLFTFIQTEKDLYMLMTWTLQDYKAQHLASMNAMATSFKIL